MFTNFAFLDLGAPELIIILAILLLLFGGKKLPELSRSLGESMRELRKGLNGDIEDKKNEEKKETDKVNSKDTVA
jgi:sec-independent protein translocase protein TatA